MAVCQNLVPLVNIEIAGKWMLIPLKMVLIGIDPYPYENPLGFAKRNSTQTSPHGSAPRRHGVSCKDSAEYPGRWNG
jgi:hypothetical protein